MFEDGVVPEEVTQVTMVLLPKGRGGYWGIGLMKVVWKICVVVENCWLKRSVRLHDALHGFRTGRGMGISMWEAKLAQQLVGLAHEPLFWVFWGVQKAYVSLDRGRGMEILWDYVMVQNMAHLIAHHWDNRQFVPNVRGFLGRTFSTGRGFT